ncbi:sigma-70 family RNA polymerase sigma factor [Ferrimonas kyonanensis]|uniref:sigma-70 family RNA polymerase sigma factor n=1 Tax=Ferrimonas kyonanensis TaxID=364763 RepID=UPI001B7FBDF7|nr:sigma-70 family RNA polymerase sigma factor [Ferrimonas kyonanensis]
MIHNQPFVRRVRNHKERSMQGVAPSASTNQPETGMVKSPNNDPSPQALSKAMIQVANDRDKRAYAMLFKHFANRVHAFCFKKVGDDQLAREVAQDTMLAVWQKAHRFDVDKGNVSTWIYTIARNRCFDLGRQKLSRPVLVSSDDLYSEPAPQSHDSDRLLQLATEKKRLHQLLANLPENQRQVVSLVYLKEMSHQAAAQHLQLPVGTVKSRLRLAMEKLALRLNKGALGYD